MEEAYRQARKRGEQGRRRAISQSEHPYLTDLDSLVAQLPLGQRENVGLRDITLEMVVGTVTKGRQSAFSCNFMPLLPFNTEFAHKWSNLYDIQVTEGYRDPIIVTEFMHRFYVQEGNNRVSIEILVDNAYFADSKKDDAAGDFPADDQFAGYGAYQGSVPGGGDDFAPDF